MIVAQPLTGNANAAARVPLQHVARVDVTVQARLHLGFVDLNGNLGRRFGSLGMAIDTPCTRLSMAPSRQLGTDGADADRARHHVEALIARYGLSHRLHVRVDESIPRHAGLGSGTQLSLAVGMAASRLFGLDLDVRAIARLLDRGARSGIGVATFEQGGVVLDGGRGERDEPPPVVSRLAFPEAWRLLLVFDNGRRGLHGPDEAAAFRQLVPFPADTAAHLCRLMLMVALPALAEEDFDRFGKAIGELQRSVGDHFKPVQGGRFMSSMVADVLAWLEAEGIAGVGQSSWGPTGFGIIGGEAEAIRLLGAARRRWPAESGLSFAVTRGRNRGADIEVVPSER